LELKAEDHRAKRRKVHSKEEEKIQNEEKKSRKLFPLESGLEVLDGGGKNHW